MKSESFYWRPYSISYWFGNDGCYKKIMLGVKTYAGIPLPSHGHQMTQHPCTAMVQEVNISCIWVINNSSSRQKSFKVVVYILWNPVEDSLYFFSVHLCFVSESLGRCYHISPNILKHIAAVAINGLFYNKMYRDIKYYHFLWSASNVSYQLLVKMTINDFCMRSTDCKTLMGRHFFYLNYTITALWKKHAILFWLPVYTMYSCLIMYQSANSDKWYGADFEYTNEGGMIDKA